MERIETVLTNEHREIEGKLNHILNSKINDKKLELFDEVSNEILNHIAVEEEVYYSKIRDKINQNYEIEESMQEHHIAKVIIDEINQTDINESQWLAKMEVLKENLEHHHKEEESDFFKKSEQKFTSEVAQELAGSFKAAKELINHITVPH